MSGRTRLNGAATDRLLRASLLSLTLAFGCGSSGGGDQLSGSGGQAASGTGGNGIAGNSGSGGQPAPGTGGNGATGVAGPTGPSGAGVTVGVEITLGDGVNAIVAGVLPPTAQVTAPPTAVAPTKVEGGTNG